jgi:hypothetical protein
LSIINFQLKLNACTYLVVDGARTVLLDTSASPLRIEALIFGDDEWVGDREVETEVLTAELVEEVLVESVTQRDVLYLQE